MANQKAQKALAPAFMPVDGRGMTITDKYVLGATNPPAADTIDFKVPGGMLVTDMSFIVDDIDSGTASLFGVGYRAVDPASSLTPSTTYFFAAGQTTGQAGGRINSSAKPIKFEEDVYIQITIGTAGAGANTGQEIHMIASGIAAGIK